MDEPITRTPGDLAAAQRPRDLDPVDPVGAVDEVLATTDGLDERPVAEHVAVFERAHESLRRALAGGGTRG